MKNTFTLLAILILSSIQSFSQNVTNAPYLGLKAAANFSMNSFSDPSLSGYDVKYKTGFAGGLYYNIPVSNRFSIQPELFYSQMGSKLESTVDGLDNITMQIDYVTIPVLFKYSPIKNLGIFAGPELMLMTMAKLNYENADDANITSQLKNIDPVGTLGAEYWFTKNFGIYGRYIFGFSNINLEEPGPWMNQQFLTSKITNSAIQVGITIGFPGSEEASVEKVEQVKSAPADRDGDGVSDKEDRCPDVAGMPDNLGCPDMVLYYQHDEATLDSSDKANLDRVVKFMNENPKVNIIIEGYSSAQGDSAYNQTLSEKRAQASYDYLASKGVSTKRMKAVGYGERVSVGDNNTQQEQSQNRRVVIRVAK